MATSYGLMDCPSTEGRNASYPTTLYPFQKFDSQGISQFCKEPQTVHKLHLQWRSVKRLQPLVMLFNVGQRNEMAIISLFFSLSLCAFCFEQTSKPSLLIDYWELTHIGLS
jgi:hypothetical protein